MARRGPRDPTDDDRRIWARVSGTVTPPTRRKAARVIPGAIVAQDEAETPIKSTPRGVAVKKRGSPPAHPAAAASSALGPLGLPQPSAPASTRPRAVPEELEPRRQRRLSRERDPIEARIDLHGFGRFEAEDQLRGFLIRCQMRGMRSVLVITGQGRRGGGIIRSSVHDWLMGPNLRGIVSGFAPAHRRHGGDGALYVTLKPLQA
ncbi:Smr/MutS family protein [Brevundimonas vesicularis]|uniref:Smr/MutS family protein n=1 Tax=Brevundimonas vesicularis TaxID=41276 RepID=UPI0038D3BB40